MALSLASDVTMAHAREPQAQDVHEELAMTPVTLMSSVHCADCAKTELSAEHTPLKTSSCAGHCFSQGRSTAIGAFPLSLPDVPAPVAMAITIAWTSAPDYRDVSNAGPPKAISTKTIVLRL